MVAMSDRLPPDFDADRYLASYSDVGLTGLDPKEHYRRFGRLMGRSPTGKSSGPTPPPVEPPPDPRSTSSDRPRSQAAAKVPPQTIQPPIIDRPSGFDAAEVRPAPAAA